MKYFLLLFLLVSCVAQPYVQPGMSDVSNRSERIVEKVLVQCWDNSTVESLDKCPVMQEVEPVVEELDVAEPEANPVITAKTLLDEARTKFSSYAYLLDDRMVIVVGDKARHYFLKMSQIDNIPITDVFFDLNSRVAVAYCNVEREGRDILGDAFDWQRSRCKGYMDVPFNVSFDDWAFKGPLEYLEEFGELEPLLVENNVQTISIGGNSKTIQPSLHYFVDGRRVVLRIDKRYQVPLKVEREGERAVDFRDVFFDVMVLNGKQFKIDSSWVVYQPVSEYWKKEGSR